MRDNPVYDRLIQGTRWLPTELTVLIGILIGTLQVCVGGFLAISTPYALLYLALAEIAVLVLTVVTTAAYTGVMVAQWASSEAFTILRLTTLSHNEIVDAFYSFGLYRLRLLYAFSLGTLFGTVFVLIIVEGCDLYISCASLLTGLLLGLSAGLGGCLLATLNLPASALGVWAGLRFRNPVIAGMMAVIPLLFFTSGILCTLSAPSLICWIAVLLLVPLMLTPYIRQRAARWV